MKNKLREVRTKKGISQLELSRLTKIAPANICNIENGKQYPYSGWRRRIVEVLDMPEEKVFPECVAEGEGKGEKLRPHEYLGLYAENGKYGAYVVKIKAATEEEAKGKFISCLDAKIDGIFSKDKISIIPFSAIKEVP